MEGPIIGQRCGQRASGGSGDAAGMKNEKGAPEEGVTVAVPGPSAALPPAFSSSLSNHDVTVRVPLLCLSSPTPRTAGLGKSAEVHSFSTPTTTGVFAACSEVGGSECDGEEGGEREPGVWGTTAWVGSPKSVGVVCDGAKAFLACCSLLLSSILRVRMNRKCRTGSSVSPCTGSSSSARPSSSSSSPSSPLPYPPSGTSPPNAPLPLPVSGALPAVGPPAVPSPPVVRAPPPVA